jgi:hypothetical protein
MPQDTQPPAPENEGAHGASSRAEEPAATPGALPAGAWAPFSEGQTSPASGQGAHEEQNPPGAGASSYAAGPGPYATAPNAYGAYPNPQPPGAGPNPYGTGPYGAGPNPYGTGPNPYGPGPSPHAPGRYGTAYPGQPAPARPGRTRIHATWLAITILVAIVTGSSAYYFGTKHGQQPSASPRPAAASENPVVGAPPANAYQCAPTDTAAGSDPRLFSELLPVPAGATRPSAAPTPKAYTLHAYVTYLYGRSAVGHEQALLEARCFQIAVNGQWQTAGGTLISIWLVQFADSAGARSYALGQEQTDLNLMGRRGRAANISGVSDGMLIQDPGLDKYGYTFSRLFGDRANVMILIHVYVPGKWDSESSMADLLRAQASRI